MSSCIYFIENIKTFDIYIGSTCDYKKRIRTHIRELKNKKHHSIILQRSFNKYGGSIFKFKKFIECSKQDLIILEQFCLDMLQPKYNISKSALAPMMGRKHKKSTIDKMKNRRVAKGRDHYLYGTSWSAELRKKILNSRTGKKRSPATKKKMSQTAKKINAISRIDHTKQQKPVIDNLGNKFESCTKAALFHGVSQATVCDILKGRHIQTRKGVSFEYL